MQGQRQLGLKQRRHETLFLDGLPDSYGYTANVQTGWTLSCHNLGKRFGERWVFRHLELSLAQGTVLIVRGSNGSGKSTLIRLMAGLLAPTEGTVQLRWGEQNLPERRAWLGWSATDGALYRELTAREHLRWWATLHHTPATDADLIAHLERFELGARADDLLRTYSTGMRQRMRLALATWGRPPLLLLDEPDAGLDTSGMRLLERVIDEHRATGIVVLATNRHESLAWGDLTLEMGA